MKAIILNYLTDSVEVALIPTYVAERCFESGWSGNYLEEYLADELGYNLDNINYMVSEKDRVPVYEANEYGLQDPIATI